MVVNARDCVDVVEGEVGVVGTDKETVIVVVHLLLAYLLKNRYNIFISYTYTR